MDHYGQDLPARGTVRRADALRRLARPAAVSLCFALLGACLLLAASGLLAGSGVSVRTVALPGGNARLYLPAAGKTSTLSLHADGEGGHVHEDVTLDGETFGAALLLRGGIDGGEAAAVELCRRGVAVLCADKKTDAAAAWDWLTAQDFVRISSVAMLAGREHAAEALTLSAGLVGSGRECAGLILLGDEALVRAAEGFPGRNLLILTAREPTEEAKAAFLGADYDGRRVFTGYFSEGTARACEAVNARTFSARAVLARLIDWQGSCLGHAVEIPDGDILYHGIALCRWGAAVCFVLAAAVWLRRRYVTAD